MWKVFYTLLPAVLSSPWPASESQLLDELNNWSSEQLKAITTADVDELVGQKRWVEAARKFVVKRREAGADDMEKTVRQSVKKIRNELDDLVRSLDANYGQAQQISPAFQWAQNSTHIFLTVKYAARWNAPGALEVKNAKCTMDGQNLHFSGVGEHSMIVKNYTLNLILKDKCTLSSWKSASAGRMSITLEKVSAGKWSGLLDAKNPKVKYSLWESMQEQHDRIEKQREANATKSEDKKKKKKAKKDKKSKKKKRKEEDWSDDDEEEDVDDDCDMPGIYTSSKVKALCAKNFDRNIANSGPWLIKFFDDSPANQKKTHDMVHIWKHLASTLPLQHCRIGVVDCKKDKALCKSLDVMDSLPVAWRYDQAGGSPTTYTGEIKMEALAEFAVKGEQIKMEL